MDITVFLRNGNNHYRTRDYIVQQVIGLDCYGEVIVNQIVSHDTFLKRTAARDREYERFFAGRIHIDGKRLPSTMCTRVYIE